MKTIQNTQFTPGCVYSDTCINMQVLSVSETRKTASIQEFGVGGNPCKPKEVEIIDCDGVEMICGSKTTAAGLWLATDILR